MAYKFQRGDAILSGALLQEGSIEIESGFDFSMHDELVLDTSRNLTVAGMSGSGDLQAGGAMTIAGNSDLNGTLDVAGDTKLAASGVGTQIRGDLTVDEFAEFNGGATFNTAIVEDLTEGRIVLAGTGGEIEDSANLAFNGSQLSVTGVISGSSDLEIGGTVRLDGVQDATAVPADDMFYIMDDSDQFVKTAGMADVRDLFFGVVSGDATVAAGGALTIAAGAVENDMLAGSIASSKIAELSAFDTADLAEGSNLYFTDARARAAVSVTDAGGDGSLTYDSGSGVITFTGPSASEVRAHFSAGEMLQVSNGEFSIVPAEFSGSWDDVLATKDTGDLAEGSNLYYTEARWDAKMAAADTGDLAEGSNLYYTDARVHAALSVSDSNSIDMTYDAAGDFSADLRISGSQLEVVGEGLRLSALAADGTTMELSSDSLSVLKVPYALSQGEGISVFSFDGSSDVTIGLDSSVAGDGLAYSAGVLSLDLQELTDADVAVGADFIAIVDADDNSTKKESIADLVSAMAGAGLTATDGVLKVTGNDVHSKADGDTLQEGYNYFADASADAAVTLPASPSDGDVVHVKAGDLTSDAVITISAQGSHNIDSEASIVLESPFAAVSLVYVGNNDWRIV